MTTTKQQAMSIANSANAGASDTLLLLETKNGLLSGVQLFALRLAPCGPVG